MHSSSITANRGSRERNAGDGQSDAAQSACTTAVTPSEATLRMPDRRASRVLASHPRQAPPEAPYHHRGGLAARIHQRGNHDREQELHKHEAESCRPAGQTTSPMSSA